MIFDDGIKDDEKLSGAGDDGEFRRFSGGAEMLVEVFDGCVAAGGGDGGHVKDAPDGGATAAADTFSFPAAAFSWERSDAGERGDLFMRENAEFGHLCDKCGGENGADAGNGLQECGVLAQGV